jgi:hypothetical protein
MLSSLDSASESIYALVVVQRQSTNSFHSPTLLSLFNLMKDLTYPIFYYYISLFPLSVLR